MFNFDYYNPTRIIFGKDRLDELGKQVPKNAKVLITYGGGSAKINGLIDRVKASIFDRNVIEFGSIEPNPKYETCLKAVEVVKKEKIDFILAVGGGSVLDGTKFITFAAAYDGNPFDILMSVVKPLDSTKIGNVIPYGTVLTKPATGSEMNPTAVITYNHGKFFFSNELVYPKFSILDPKITFTLPKKHIANGIIDAFIHVTEQYLTFPVDARVQDRISEGILQTLIEVGEQSVREPENYDVRANHVWSATMALNGLIGAGVPQDWTTHFIGHELTSLFNIDHGETLAIIGPKLWEIRKEKKKEKLVQYAERIWRINTGTEYEKIDLAINKTIEFFNKLGVKTRLSEYGVGEDKIPLILEKLREHGMTAMSETGDLTIDIAEIILRKAI